MEVHNVMLTSAGSSSDGTYVFVTNTGKYFAVNTDKCRKISGTDEYLNCYLSNSLRMFVEARVRYYSNNDAVEVSFPNEKVSFVCKNINFFETFISKGKRDAPKLFQEDEK